MKRWTRRDEWMELAYCAESDVHTGEDLSDDELAHAAAICGECRVRPECIQWAIRDKACSVVVAGVYLPDPMHKKDLRAAYLQLQQSLPEEQEARGEEV